MECKCGSSWMIFCPHCQQYAPPSEWKSVKDFPVDVENIYILGIVDSKRVLGIMKKGIFYTVEWIDDPTFDMFNSFEELIEWIQTHFTHWMPLPVAPAADADSSSGS